nr:uncharacterized protein LOC132778090 [Anolis sagrei ordinatus]
MIPVLRTNHYFTQWKKDMMNFVWCGKKARMDARERGGFGLPNLQSYYEAYALSWVKEWSTLKKKKLLNLEGFNIRRGWHAYLWHSKVKIEKNFSNHFIRAALLKVWEKHKGRLYSKTPLWLSPIEASHKREMPSERWHTYKVLLERKENQWKLKSLESLRETDENLSWFHYMQVADCFKEDRKKDFSSQETFWDTIMGKDRKVVRALYQKLLEWETETETVKENMITWAVDFGHTILLSEWESVWRGKLKFAKSANIIKNWQKVFHCWYLTPQKLAKFYKGVNSDCWKCGAQLGTYYHA